jgi:hypothetical protein
MELSVGPRFSGVVFAALVAGFLPGLASPAQAQDNRPVMFHNQCNAPVRLLVYHAEDPRRWQVNGFYTIAPNARTTLSVRGEMITHITGHSLFYYAELPNGRTFGTAERNVPHNGASYAMSRATVTVNGGNNVFAVRC